MEPEQVYSSGRAVMDYADSASAVAGRYLGSLGDASATVGHPTVSGALDRYAWTWQPLVTGVAADIDALGHNTSASAVVVTDSDHTGAATLAPLLHRDPNAVS